MSLSSYVCTLYTLQDSILIFPLFSHMYFKEIKQNKPFQADGFHFWWFSFLSRDWTVPCYHFSLGEEFALAFVVLYFYRQWILLALLYLEMSLCRFPFWRISFLDTEFRLTVFSFSPWMMLFQCLLASTLTCRKLSVACIIVPCIKYVLFL